MKSEAEVAAFRAGFIAGFAVSREGFNGECAYDHLAPPSIDSGRRWFDDLARLSDDPELRRLQDEALILESAIRPTCSRGRNDK